MAQRLAQEDGERREILIDTLNGDAHRAYGSLPDMVFIMNRHGCVVWRAEWNEVAATTRALEAMLADKPPQVTAHFKPVAAKVTWQVLRRAGHGALWDYLRNVPRLVVKKLSGGRASGPAQATAPEAPGTQC